MSALETVDDVSDNVTSLL